MEAWWRDENDFSGAKDDYLEMIGMREVMGKYSG